MYFGEETFREQILAILSSAEGEEEDGEESGGEEEEEPNEEDRAMIDDEGVEEEDGNADFEPGQNSDESDIILYTSIQRSIFRFLTQK